jgi:hypothetical protein
LTLDERKGTWSSHQREVFDGHSRPDSPRPSKLRARQTNQPRRLDHVDMRSADGRRYADLYDGLVLEFPGIDPARLREVAILKHAAEKALAVGAFEDAVKLVNTADRKERSLREGMIAARAAHVAARRRRKRASGKSSNGSGTRAAAPSLEAEQELARIRAHRVAFEQELAARIEAAGKQGGAP